MHTVNPLALAAQLDEFWSPRVIGEVDDHFIKVAKVRGTLVWHSHPLEDEMFMVLRGRLRIEMIDSAVELSAGDVFVVPKGVEHNPVADEECLLMLFERKSTAHTGDTQTALTRSLAEQLRPLQD